MFQGLSNALANWGQQASSWIDKNPEQFAIGLDMAGQAFDPNNIAAGVGTQFAQASLMDKASKEAEAKAMQRQKQQQEWWKELLAQALQGKVTMPGQPGPSNISTKIGHDGTGTVTITGDLAKAIAGQDDDMSLGTPVNPQ